MGWLRMQDFLTLEVKESENKRYLFECKDSKSPTGVSLFVKTEATHSGIVNGNARFYRPDRMQDSCHTWTPKGRALRPVLRSHLQDGEPLGRIHKARYVDLSYQYNNEFPGVKGLCFYDSGAKKLNLFNSVDWVLRNLHGRPDYKGLGYIELDMNISDPDAIQKIQDDRYLTVSVGFGTDAAVCSICHTDWAEDDRCDHELGHLYDGKPMFLISGNFVYKECSFVNFPADPWGAVTSKDSIQQVSDSVANRVFFMGLTRGEQQKRLVLEGADALDTDSITFLGSDIQPLEDNDFEEDRDMDLKAIQTEIKSKDLTKDRALALRSELESIEDKASAKRTLSTLNAKIRASGWADAAVTKESVEAAVAGLDAHLATLAEADRAAYTDALAVDAKAFGVEFNPPAPAEAAVEPPVQNAEPPAAQASDSDALQWISDLVTAETVDADKAKTFDPKPVISALDALDKAHTAVPEDSRYLFRSAVSAMLEHWYAGSSLDYYKTRLVEKGSDAVIAKSELDELHAAVEKYEDTLKQSEASNRALLTTNHSLIAEQKKTLARVLVAGSVVLGKKGFTGLSADEIANEIGTRSQRRLNSLQDSLEDLLKELPGADLKAASGTTPTEGAVRQVSDNAKVADTSGPEKTDSTEVTPAGETAVVPLTMLDPKTARRAMARADFEARRKAAANTHKE